MKMIKPIVNIAKVIDAYDAVICGFNGVVHDGVDFLPEAVNALVGLYRSGKKIVVLSNISCRTEELARIFYRAGVSPRLFTAMVTAGEILHARLQSSAAPVAGRSYYNLGGSEDESVFAGLSYRRAPTVDKADFLYIGHLPAGRTTEDYMEVLSHAASLGLPLLCAGNDTSVTAGEDVIPAAGAVAEQYAVLGGGITTVGKPDRALVEYALASLPETDRRRVLMIGDSMPTDIKAATAAGLSSCLISKGVHVNFLGGGYIPDVTKARELGNITETYPDYVISGLRW